MVNNVFNKIKMIVVTIAKATMIIVTTERGGVPKDTVNTRIKNRNKTVQSNAALNTYVAKRRKDPHKYLLHHSSYGY